MAPSIVLPSTDDPTTTTNSNGVGAEPPSPTPSTRSFLDSDPYPHGGIRRHSYVPHDNDNDDNHDPSSSYGLSSHPTDSTVPTTTNSASLLLKLETLLRSKANEIHLAGQLGASLLAQQTELESRIREIAEVHAEFAAASPVAGQRRVRGATGGGEDGDSSEGEKEVGEETKRRLKELEEELMAWDQGNKGLYETVGRAVQVGVPNFESTNATTTTMGLDDMGTSFEQHQRAATYDSPPRNNDNNNNTATTFDDSLDSAPLHHIRRRAPSLSSSSSSTNNHPGPNSQPLAPSSSIQDSLSTSTNTASSSRRARNNVQHRTNDIELATEIGQSLLSEVRRLQSLLGEKEEVLRELKGERDALELEGEEERKLRAGVEESVGTFF